MAPDSQVNQGVQGNSANKLVFQIRELYGRTTYTHKAHEKCADIYHSRLHRMKISQIVLSALTTGSLLLAVFGEGKVGTIIGAAFSTILFGLNLYLKDYDLGELSQKHIGVAARIWSIRESYLSLLTDLMTGKVDHSDAVKLRDKYQEELAAIYQNAPRTIDEAYKLAQKALKVNEEMTFSRDEINKLLPEALRIQDEEQR
jgi:hypothetical protein